MYKIKVGILNTVNGRAVIEKIVPRRMALEEAEKVSMWFDEKDTFFSGKSLWVYWDNAGILEKFKEVIHNQSLSDVAYESVAVFNKKGRGEVYEFFVRKL